MQTVTIDTIPKMTSAGTLDCNLHCPNQDCSMHLKAVVKQQLDLHGNACGFVQASGSLAEQLIFTSSLPDAQQLESLDVSSPRGDHQVAVGR